MHSFYRDPARRPMVMSSGAVACLAAPEMPCRKGGRSTASESCRLRRDEDARPHIARNSGLFTFWVLAPCWCAPTFLLQVLVRLAGSRPPGRVSLGMESAGRAQPVRLGLALGSGAIRLGWQSRQRLIGRSRRCGRRPAAVLAKSRTAHGSAQLTRKSQRTSRQKTRRKKQ